jgi:hypothetical protein
MATRGGKGGSPDAFNGGAGEGSQNPSDKYANHDYAGEWSSKKKLLSSMRPEPGGTIDYDGGDRFAGNPEARAKHAHDTKRQAAFDAEMVKRTANRIATKVAAKGALKPRRAAEVPPNKRSGVQKSTSTKEVAGKLNEHLTILEDRARELGAANLGEEHPMAALAHKYGTESLGKARASAKIAADYQFGRNGKIRSSSEANKHLGDATKHTHDAYGYLHGDDIDEATTARSLNVKAIPDGETAANKTAAQSLQVMKDAKPFKTYKMGKNKRVRVGSSEDSEIGQKAEEMAFETKTVVDKKTGRKKTITVRRKGGSVGPYEKRQRALRGTPRASAAEVAEGKKSKIVDIQQGDESTSSSELMNQDPRKTSSNFKPKEGNPLSSERLPRPGDGVTAAPRKAGDIARERLRKAAQKALPKKPARKAPIDKGPSGVFPEKKEGQE